MTQEDDKWVSQMRKRMGEHTEPLPEGLWKRIEADMPSAKVVPFWRTRKFAAAASVAVVLATSVTAWLLHSPSDDYMQKEGIAANRLLPEQTSSESEPTISELQSVETPSVDTPLMASAQPRKQSALPQTSVLLVSATPELTNQSVEEPELVGMTTDCQLTPAVPESPAKPKQTAKERQKADRRIMEQNRQQLESAQSSRKSSSWAIGVSAGNTPYSSTGTSGLGGFSQKVMSDAASDWLANDTYTELDKAAASKSVENKPRHKMPVSVGASIKVDWNEKWAFETGLYYTYLASELTENNSRQTKVNQKLHYIGVPLKVHRQLWHNGRFAVYASGGAMIEKCVKGSQDITENFYSYVSTEQASGANLPATSGVTNYTAVPRTTTEHVNLESHPWQLSAQLSVGAQAKLGKNFGLYVEPGAAYYFDDRSEISTIRKDHPFNFNLQVGVRYHFSK